MGWRVVSISKPSKLSIVHNSLCIEQSEGPIKIPVEDIDVLVIDNQQILITASVLSILADFSVAVITTSSNHLPNAMLLPFQQHSRSLNVVKSQLALSAPQKKKLWKKIIQQKIYNQAVVLKYCGKEQKGWQKQRQPILQSQEKLR